MHPPILRARALFYRTDRTRISKILTHALINEYFFLKIVDWWIGGLISGGLISRTRYSMYFFSRYLYQYFEDQDQWRKHPDAELQTPRSSPAVFKVPSHLFRSGSSGYVSGMVAWPLDIYACLICTLRIDLNGKVHIFWEGHKILRNLHLTFDCMYIL